MRQLSELNGSDMFPQLKKCNSESGIVLFVVLMTSIIIMILSLGILTESLTEMNYAQQQIDQITSEQLAKGMFWNMYASGMNSMPSSSIVANVTGRSYNMSVLSGSAAGGTTPYNVVVNFDSFN